MEKINKKIQKAEKEDKEKQTPEENGEKPKTDMETQDSQILRKPNSRMENKNLIENCCHPFLSENIVEKSI